MRRMSLIEEGPQKQVRMAHLAIVGSHSVNGVAALHSELLKTSLMPDFYPALARTLYEQDQRGHAAPVAVEGQPGWPTFCQTIGDGWITDLDELIALEPYAYDPGFQRTFMDIKHANKARLATVIQETTQCRGSQTLFDIQVKRIHEYKRQLLNVMRIIHEYLCLVEDQMTSGAAHLCVCRQRRPRVLGRQADH